MILSDGRKILPYSPANQSLPPEYFIQTHPDFRMIVLANRPGFPFLGNDFFAALGDLFSCHAVDNPSTDSEIFLLQQYGPNVPKATLMKLVSAFAELRSMADVGQLSYPYSTREVVNIVRHLEKFPNEDLSVLIGNVLDFDRYTPESLEQVTDVLQKHGLEIGSYAKDELALLRRKREIQLTIQHSNQKSVSMPKHGKEDPENKPHVGGNTWAGELHSPLLSVRVSDFFSCLKVAVADVIQQDLVAEVDHTDWIRDTMYINCPTLIRTTFLIMLKRRPEQ